MDININVTLANEPYLSKDFIDNHERNVRKVGGYLALTGHMTVLDAVSLDVDVMEFYSIMGRLKKRHGWDVRKRTGADGLVHWHLYGVKNEHFR